MEDVFTRILRDSSPVKHASVRSACIESQELLANQHELMRSPPYEIRSKCLQALQLALETKQSKLVAHALSGFQRLIWDKTFQSVFETDNDETWLPCQLLQSVESITSQTDDIQVELMKILVQMTTTCNYSLSTKAVIHLISLCLDVYRKGSASLKTAAQATANQTLQVFCSMIQEPDESADEESEENSVEDKSVNLVDEVVEDLSPVLVFICGKLKNASSSAEGKIGVPLLLQCILSIMSNLAVDVHQNSTFLTFLWQELCPLLVALLGSPKTDKNIISSQKSNSGEGGEIGRGSGCLAVAPSCQSAEAKTIFSIAVELVRLVGSIGSLRPVLESLFHRMLLYPPPQHRLEALKAVRELVKNPELLLKFAGPALHDADGKSSRSGDLDLIRIAIDSLGECCHSSDRNTCYMSVSCASELLKSLEQLCSGKKVSEEYTKEINDRFKNLEDSDYKGIKSDRWRETRPTVPETAPKTVQSDLSSDYSHSFGSDDEDDVVNKSSQAIEADCAVDELTASVEVKPAVVVDDDDGDDAMADDDDSGNAEHSHADSHETGSEHESVPRPSSSLSHHSKESEEHLESCMEREVSESDKAIQSAHDALDDILSSSSSEMSSLPVLDNTEENLVQDLEDQERELEELEASRLNKVPRTLLGQEDAGKLERERVERLCTARMEFAQQERQTARKFVGVLQEFLPKLLSIGSSVEADQAMQEFASNYCEDLWQQQQHLNSSCVEEVLSHITILNADGIYLAMYSALLLNLKLIRNSYYKGPSVLIPLTEQQFIEEVHGSGVLVYLSATWLAELYQQVLAKNLLEEAGYSPSSSENSALINLLSDVDGLGNSCQGGQQLADYRRLEQAAANKQRPPSAEAGRKFARRILTSSWETILEVLSVLLNGTNSCGITSTIGFLLGTEGAKEEHRKARDAIAESIDGLQRAAKLCNALGLQSSCTAVFAQLAATSCPISDESTVSPPQSAKRDNRKQLKTLLSLRNRNLRLHTSHVLSMDVMLSRGLELGSHSPNCWKYVFQCCLYVLELENTFFSNNSGIHSVLKLSTLQALKKASDKKGQKNGSAEEEHEGNEENLHELLPMPGSVIPDELNISEIIKKNSDANTSGVVKDQLLLKIVERLSQLVDRLFEEAAGRLNLSALIGFLVELCATSQIQLFTQSYRQHSSVSSHGNNLLLYHLGEIMLRCARGGRPLIHIMKAWSVVAPHFVEAACHKDHMISKKAVTTIHDIVSALLSSSSELPHFHFNEALFKPFENLLCLELCDTDVQQQIICSMCEFVEACTTDIRSGWRPLFGALRAVRLPSVSEALPSLESEREHAHHLRVILDVFEAFLGTNSIPVFAYAAIDCLLCLLKHVQGPAEIQDAAAAEHSDLSDAIELPLDMCLAALKYLERCNSILVLMYNMPTCPVFNSANRIQVSSTPNTVDPVISGSDIVYFCQQNGEVDPVQSEEEQNIKDEADVVTETEQIDASQKIDITLKSLDNHTGILHVWFLLFEGLAGAIVTCPKKYQPHTMETLFSMLHNLKDTPGPEFGVYCINHLLLPLLQNWLRRAAQSDKGWSSFAANFKQCCGLTTDLVVDYIQYIAESSKSLSEVPGSNLVLQQLFIVLTECIAQPSETVSRLGCSCIRHTIMSAGRYFTKEFWDITCISLKRACHITLQSVKQLMVCFHADSDNFYGDLGEVKVAARKDCTPQEADRMRQLARQVFLLDCQRASKHHENSVLEDDKRSYIFLLHPPQVQNNDGDPECDVIRVPFRNLVVGLLSHQILLQTLATILLHGTRHAVGSIVTLLSFLSSGGGAKATQPNELPGFLPKLTSKHLHIIFDCLEQSCRTACDFDARPGLKFLVQKVAQIDVAANLYKQTGVSWSARALAQFEICLSAENLETNRVNEILHQRTTDDGPDMADEISEAPITKSGSLGEFYILLMKKFKDICELYTEYAMDKDGVLATVDRMADKPIFFLVAPIEATMESSADGKQAADRDITRDGHDLSHCDSSDSEEFTCETDQKDKVYNLATEQTISSLISEYKKRKIRHSMPSAFREKLRKRSSSDQTKISSSSDMSVPEEILQQRRTSITKDGEAHVLVYKQLVQAMLDVHLSLPDQQFLSLLPVFAPGVQYLVAYGTDTEVKLTAAEWLQRIAFCYGFGGGMRSSDSTS